MDRPGVVVAGADMAEGEESYAARPVAPAATAIAASLCTVMTCRLSVDWLYKILEQNRHGAGGGSFFSSLRAERGKQKLIIEDTCE